MGAEAELNAAEKTPPILRLCLYLSERSPLPMVAVVGATHIIDYLNPAFARLVGKERKDLIGRPFSEAVPEGTGNGCLAMLDRILNSGVTEYLGEQEHSHTSPAYWSYSAWPILGADELPTGVMIQVTDATEIAHFRRQAAAMNEALVRSSVRQHELMEVAESLNAQLREGHDRLEGRVAERTAELAAANAALSAEVATRVAAEVERRELIGRLTSAQEDERRRIARDLHDQMGQLLAALGLGLTALEGAASDSEPIRTQLAGLRGLTDQIGREAHQLALELRPTALDDLGLETALAQYAEAWSEHSGVGIDFQSTGMNAGRLHGTVETALYRVVQEALTNVLRHARARRVSLVLQQAAGQAVAVIEDDGVGFDPESVTTPEGKEGRLGLLGMRERVALTGGTLTVESAPGRGTTVIACVPVRAGGGEERAS